MRKTLSLLAALLAVACGGDEQTDTSALQPTITQQEANARYRVKAGRELLIAPSYTNAEGARFTWTCDDEVVCREASYVFRRDKAGIYYLSLRVENDYGAAEDELRARGDALEGSAADRRGAQRDAVPPERGRDTDGAGVVCRHT